MLYPPVRELDHSIRDQVIASGQERIHFDDFIQFMPAVAVYGLDLCTPLKAKHSFRDRTIVMATSHLLMAGTVHGLKSTVNVTRPDHSARNSFPSGHTATAFTGAHILFREYKDESMWIGVAGYAAATSTGVFRVLNNCHWLSDVMAGAGIGILSAEVGYLLLPVFKNMMGLKDTKKTFVIAPVAQAESIGVGMSYTF
ncbi:MAG: phosphatase PAP2 family protein [Tannerellaceae bacterium]|nr:phosphatase PAP2 family protein [Tannerellaceae bacterium]MCD8263739.1 phosphatase PAP2 family protein [Tannerellaceae bacterium]